MANSGVSPATEPRSAGSTKKHRGQRDNRELGRLIAAVVALVLLVAFVLDNRETVTVGFIFFSTRIRLIWVLLITALLGAGVDRLIILLARRRRRRARTAP